MLSSAKSKLLVIDPPEVQMLFVTFGFLLLQLNLHLHAAFIVDNPTLE